jgi:3-hydroxybutyryl-CoA dehydrogenase
LNIKKIGVVGAGGRGAEIALCFALRGYAVIMTDLSDEIAAKGKQNQADILEKRVAKGSMSATEKDAVLARVVAVGPLENLTDCDVVVEAAPEILEVKADIYQQLDAICKPSCVIAGSASRIPITELAAAVPRTRAERFLGARFPAPASATKRVEVAPSVRTAPAITARVIDLLTDIGKEPIQGKDGADCARGC